jgi:short-subunit dehydrogenase
MPGFVETEGFPQRSVFPRVVHPVIAEPEDVALAVLKAVDHDKRELFVPWYYRLGAIAQALFPGAVARSAASGRLRKPA